MNYYIQETVFDETRNRTAASKAREDINEIVSEMGFKPIEVQYDYELRKTKGFIAALKRLSKDWANALSKVNKSDILLIQYPCNHHPLRIARNIKKLHRRGGKVIFLIHDVDCLRARRKTLLDRIKYLKIQSEDSSILKCGDAIIAHNDKMILKLREMGIDKDKLIALEIFDYIVHNADNSINKRDKDDPIIIAGTLRKGKAGYVYSLPENCKYNLYGVGYEEQDKEYVKYFGSFNPEELVSKLDGSFGLVWDGSTCETCSGTTGEYLKINNPHKTSLYLAAGLPVIVWKQAAIADFVNINRVGITINKISDIQKSIDNLSKSDYEKLLEEVRNVSVKIKKGFFAERAIQRSISLLQSQVNNKCL